MNKHRSTLKIGWKEGGLQIAGGRHVYIFYKIHLLRLLAVILAVSALIFLGRYLLQREYVTVVWKTGNLYVYHESSQQWVKSNDRKFDRPAAFRVGDDFAESLQSFMEEDLQERLQTLAAERSVIRYNPFETVVLTTGASVSRRADGVDGVEYSLQGVVFLTLNPAAESPSPDFFINGVHIGANGCTLMYQDLILPAEITVVSGECWISPPQKKFMHMDDELLPSGERAMLSEDNVLVLTDELIYLEEKYEDRGYIRKSSFLPGFDLIGHYRSVGHARIDDGEYDLIRYGKTYHVNAYQVPLMAGDIVANTSFRPVVIELDSGDRFKLHAHSQVTIPDPLPEPGEDLPLLMMTNRTDTQHNAVILESYDFPLKGTIRVYCTQASVEKGLHFITPHGVVVPVNASEFEVVAANDNSTVFVVSGIVELRSTGGDPAISVGRGYLSRIEKANAPILPYPISPERFRELLTDSFHKEQKPLLQMENQELERLSLKEGKQLEFNWNKPIESANLVIDGIAYPLTATDDPHRVVLKRSDLQDVTIGKYPVRIEALDYNKHWGESLGLLSVLPGHSLGFLCGRSSRTFSQEERDAIMTFQREAGLRVDGIAGSETRAKAEEILDCSR